MGRRRKARRRELLVERPWWHRWVRNAAFFAVGLGLAYACTHWLSGQAAEVCRAIALFIRTMAGR